MPGPSTTPESHRPAVVMGLNADCVLRERSDSGKTGEGSSVGDARPSVEGRMTVGVGMARTGGLGAPSSAGVSAGVCSFEGISIGVGSANCLRRRISSLRLFSLSSSVSDRVST